MTRPLLTLAQLVLFAGCSQEPAAPAAAVAASMPQPETTINEEEPLKAMDFSITSARAVWDDGWLWTVNDQPDGTKIATVKTSPESWMELTVSYRESWVTRVVATIIIDTQIDSLQVENDKLIGLARTVQRPANLTVDQLSTWFANCLKERKPLRILKRHGRTLAFSYGYADEERIAIAVLVYAGADQPEVE